MAENIFRQRILSNPDKPVIIMEGSGKVVTAIELENRANQVAQLLLFLGVTPGDKIALLIENKPEFWSFAAQLQEPEFFTLLSAPI